MTTRPRASLGRILEDLGTTLLSPVAGAPALDVEVHGVVILDPLDEPQYPAAAIVLGVGLAKPDDIVSALEAVAPEHPAGLVVRAPVSEDARIAEAAARTGVPVLALTRGASWTQLAALLRSLLSEGGVGAPSTDRLGGAPLGDLFALANALAAVLDAPVTIEDRSLRVLAFSGGQDRADGLRVETILGRQVPERLSGQLAERGIFRELYRSSTPVWVDPIGEGIDDMHRVALAVRAGDEVLGSIWVAVHEPLTDERAEALHGAANVVALHMLQLRAGADVEQRLRADLLATALEGGTGAANALERLGLAGQPISVVACEARPEQDGQTQGDADSAANLRRLSDAFALHLSAVNPMSAASLIGTTTYGLIPSRLDDRDGEKRAVHIAEEFLQRANRPDWAVIAVGPVARDAAALAGARATADRILRVLRSGGSRAVATESDVYVDSLILDLRDLLSARGGLPAGAVSRLSEYDEGHRSDLVNTLTAWLEEFGDIGRAAARVHVHPNTFRYRLRRVAEVARLDLDDPEARFAAMLQLRVSTAGPTGRGL